MSSDGRLVAFSSGGANLVSGDTNDRYDVFLRSLPVTFVPGTRFAALAAGQVQGGVDFGDQQLAEIRGTKWNDVNANEVRDPGEPVIVGVTIYLDGNDNGEMDEGEPSQVTNGNGEYVFADLTPGEYAVREVVPSGFRQTCPGPALELGGYYGAAYAGGTGQTQLIRIDDATGAITWIGAPMTTNMAGLVATNDGSMFGINGWDDALYSVDPQTGQVALIGATGYQLVYGLAYDRASDTIFGLGRLTDADPILRLVRFDRTTGAVTPIGPGLSGMNAVSALAFDLNRRQLIAFDNFDDEFYAFDTSGNGRYLSTAAPSIDSWSMAANGHGVVLQASGLDNDTQLAAYDPDTGTRMSLLTMSGPVVLESLDYVPPASFVQRIAVVAGQSVTGLDFGNFDGQAPVVSGVEGWALGYSKGAPATPLSGTLVVSDPDSVTLLGSGNGAGGQYNPANKQYFGFASYDSARNVIGSQHVLKYAGATDTTLAAALNPGDTVVYLTSVTGWCNAGVDYQRHLAWYGDKDGENNWGYRGSDGTFYGAYSYTRNVLTSAWSAGAVNATAKTMTLKSAWTGPRLEAGTPVRNATSGNSYNYAALGNGVVGSAWTTYTATISGVQQNGMHDDRKFRPGTASIKPLMLVNYQNTTDNLVIWRDVSWSYAGGVSYRAGDRVDLHLTAEAAGLLGGTVTCGWTQVDGPPVTLENSNTRTATFVVPAGVAGTTLSFRLNAASGSVSLLGQMSVSVAAGSLRVASSATAFEFAPRPTDQEYARDPGSGQLRAMDSCSARRVDLLNAVMHELGHVAGWADEGAKPDGLTRGVLETGVRRSAYAVVADELMAEWGIRLGRL